MINLINETKKLNSNPLKLSPGCFSEQHWGNRKEMAESMPNWKYNCSYQLQAKALCGRRQILDLNSMQINYIQRPGGMMFSPSSPKNSFTIIVFNKCVGQTCYGRMKIKTGDIIFFDSSELHNFINNGDIELIVVTIHKSSLGTLSPILSKIINHRIYDTDAQLSSTLHNLWERFTSNLEQKMNAKNIQEADDEILSVIMLLLSKQTPGIA